MMKSVRLLGAFACAIALTTTLSAKAEERGASGNVVEEIIVTARQQEETLQDVPVTVAALTETDLDRYNITTLTEASKLVPTSSSTTAVRATAPTSIARRRLQFD